LTLEAVERNKPALSEGADFQIWHFVTRGAGEWAHESGPPTVGIRVKEFNFEKFAGIHEKGIHGVITSVQSYPATALDSRVKHYSRMNFSLAELEAADVDPKAWPILTNMEGAITEGVNYNVLIVRGDRLIS